MKALSYLQPWPIFILNSQKPVENRGVQYKFKTPFPQDVLLHSSKGYDADAPLQILGILKRLKYQPPAQWSNGPRGVILGVVRFFDACKADDLEKHVTELDFKRFEPWAFGPWCYLISRTWEFETPIPYKGRQGMFEVPDDTPDLAYQLERAGYKP